MQTYTMPNLVNQEEDFLNVHKQLLATVFKDQDFMIEETINSTENGGTTYTGILLNGQQKDLTNVTALNGLNYKVKISMDNEIAWFTSDQSLADVMIQVELDETLEVDAITYTSDLQKDLDLEFAADFSQYMDSLGY